MTIPAPHPYAAVATARPRPALPPTINTFLFLNCSVISSSYKRLPAKIPQAISTIMTPDLNGEFPHVILACYTSLMSPSRTDDETREQTIEDGCVFRHRRHRQYPLFVLFQSGGIVRIVRTKPIRMSFYFLLILAAGQPVTMAITEIPASTMQYQLLEITATGEMPAMEPASKT